MRPAYLTKKLVAFLKDGDLVIRLKPLGKYYGFHLYMNGQDVILINHRKGDILGTLVHEILHFLYEDKPHKWIYDQEDYWMTKSSWKQKKQVLNELLNLA